MKGLKLWQAILLIFGSICVATGGVFLYTYLTSGFGNEVIEAENINFKTDDNLYNINLNQFEVDGDFSLVVNATNEDVTEKNITLSFTKKLSNENLSTERTYVKDGVTYITNGIISIPQNATIGTPFNVIVEQKQYQYDGMSFITNVGGITTIHAKSSNKLDAVGANLTIAVDVPVKEIKLTARDTTNGKEYKITNYEINVLQNTNFELVVNYYPVSSRYRYSDNLYKEYTGAEEYTARVKDYCFQISAGTDIQKQYNNGDVYFTSSANLTTGNKISTYVFANAKKQEEFEATALDLSGENYYNSMLSYLDGNKTDRVKEKTLNCSITQADIGNMFILNSSFEAKTNKLFTLVANNNNLGSGSLGLSISDSEDASLSSMISQTAIRVSYKKAGDVDFTYLTADDKTVVVKSVDKMVVGTTIQSNPYVFNGALYFFPTTNVKNLNNAYWEISTSESAIEIKIEVVLFKTKDGVTTIFDESGDKLSGGRTRTAIINVTENEDEADVAWLGNLTENLSIIYKGADKVPSQIDLSSKTSVPVTNTYQTVKYFVRKLPVYDEEGDVITEDISQCVNVEGDGVEIGGVTYYEASTRVLLFKEAGTYAVMFMTIKTDAYNNILYEYEEDGITVKGYQISKQSSEISIVVSETLQSFKQTVLDVAEDKILSNGVFVKTKDTSMNSEKTYYVYNSTEKTFSKSIAPEFKKDTDYYELSYYAIKSGEEAKETLILNIEVAESSTDMLKGEINDKDNLKFYAVSADGSIEIPLTLVEMVATDWTKDDEGLAIPTRISYYLNLDTAISILSNDGKGLGFYIVSRYFNTIETIETKIELENYAKTIDFENNGQKETFKCFMIYTPDAREIENTELANKSFDVIVKMNQNAEYNECSVLVGNEEKGGITYLNELMEKTYVLDAYGREFGTKGSNYTVRTSQGANAVYIVDNQLNFASGKENVEIIVSAGNVNYSYALKVESQGIYSVTLGDETYKNFNNLALNETISKGTEYPIFDKVKANVYLGGSELAKKFIYLKDVTTNTELLQMFEFYDMSGNKIDSLSTTTPISKFKAIENFAQSASITFYVSNKDYSNTNDTSKETVRFEFVLNITANVNSNVNFNDKADKGMLTDAVYAGYEYELDNLITLKDSSNNAISWTSSQYAGNTYYILADGTVEIYDKENQKDNAIGEISGGGEFIQFYDVATETNYLVKLYYYTGNNNYAYHCELNVKVVPNIIFEQTSNTEINIIELATADQGISNYYKLARNRGNEKIENVVMEVNTKNVPVEIATDGTVFKFKEGEALAYNYNEYSRQIEIGLSLNDKTICDKDGNAVVYNNLYLVVQNTPEGEEGKTYHSKINSMLKGILKTGGNSVTTTMYNGVLALEVKSGVNYQLSGTFNSNESTGKYDMAVNTNNMNLYENPNSSKIFSFNVSEATDDELIFGENCYIYVILKTNEDNPKTIASINVPVCVSSVGDVYAYYNDENFFTRDDVDITKIIQSENYDLKTLLYGDENGAPYATMKAGQEIQIAYKGSREYYSSKTTYSYNFTKEGIYYNDGASVTITFEDGSTQNKYATILTNNENGNIFIHFANYAGEDVLLKLKVRVENGTSHLDYTYRIMLQANISAKTTYPLAEGEDTAEYVSIATSENYNLANAFGSYAGTKADKARFATEIEFTGGTLVYDSTKEYYFQQGASKELLNGQHILEAGAYIADADGNTYILAKSIILSDITETIEKDVLGTHMTLVRLKLAEETYLIKEIEVGGNASGSAQGVTFGNFTTSTTKTQNEYTVVYLIDGDTKTFTISANGGDIAKITLTTLGVLNVSVYNNDYYINLIIRRELTNVVDGDLDYRFFINNESGTTYIEYNESTGESFATNKKDDLKKAEATIVSGTNYNLNLYTKYSTDAGTSMTDVILDSVPQIELSYTEGGEEKTIANNGTITDVSLTRVSAGNYTLTFKTANFIDRDYVVKFVFNSGDKTISTLYATLKCSVNVERNESTIYGGETIVGTTWINDYFKFTDASGATITNVSFVSIESTDEDNVINSNGNISSLISDVQNVTIDVKLSMSGNVFYRTLTFDIEKDITVKSSVIYGEKHYAGETISYSTTNFYDGTFSNGTLTSTVTIPLSYVQYIKSATVLGTNINVETNNVKTEINNARVIVKFNYVSDSGYEYNFQSEFVFNILPNVEAKINYPQPTEDIEYTNESVYFNESYSNFFNSSAVFTTSKVARVIYSKKSTGAEISSTVMENARVFVSEIFGMTIYAKVKVKNAEDFGSYYTRSADGTFSLAGGAYNASETYYYKFDVGNHAKELTGLNQDFYFAHYGAFDDGYATFQVIYNEVEAEYKIYAYDKVVDMEIINTVNTVNGVEEIFLDQLTEGNIFAENSVAKLSMGDLASGTYYIKISNNGNVANQYHWVGFTYDASKGDSINVLLGESASFEFDDYGDPIFGDNTLEKGKIIGLYATRDSGGAELFTERGASISLCSIANMSYKYNNGAGVEYVGIDSAYLYTNLVKRQFSDKDDKVTASSGPTLVYKYNGKWYNAETDQEITISDENLAKYLYGKYEVYEKYIAVGGNKTYVSQVEEDIVTGANGFGQLLEKVTGGTIKDESASGSDVYTYTNGEGETVYVDAGSTSTYYQAKFGYSLELNESGSTFASTVTVKADGKKDQSTDVDKEFTHFKAADGYTYFVTKANTKNVKLTNAYKLINSSDTSLEKLSSYKLGAKNQITTPLTKVNSGNAPFTYITSKTINNSSATLKIKTNNSNILNHFKLYADSDCLTEVTSDNYLNGTYYIKVTSNETILSDTYYELIDYYNNNKYYYYNNNFYTPIGGTYYKIGSYYADKLLTDDVGGTESFSLSNVETTTISKTTYYKYGSQYITSDVPTYSFDENTVWFARVKVSKSENLTGKTFTGANYKVKDENGNQLAGYIDSSNIFGSGVFGETGATIIYRDYSNNYYIIKKDDIKNGDVKILVPGETGKRNVYKAETVVKNINDAVKVDNNDSVKKTDGYYFYNRMYIKQNDVVTTQINSKQYQVINLEDFNISHVSGMVIDDTTAIIKFQYIIGEVKNSFEYKFKLKIDVEVQNAIDSNNVTSDVKQTSIDGFTSLNYIEIETNKEYNFNELVGVNRKSSGDVLDKQDVRSSTVISINIIDQNDAELSDDIKKSLGALATQLELKTNTSENILLSYEIVKTQSGENGTIYNFNLMPLGADNNGDYVLVKYTYTVQIADYVWKNSEEASYTMTKYVLFKILPDYAVSMHDLSNLPVTIYEEKLDNGHVIYTNENNPVLLDNFDEVGALQDEKSLLEVLGVGNTAEALKTFAETDNNGTGALNGFTADSVYLTIGTTEIGRKKIERLSSDENYHILKFDGEKYYIYKNDCVNGTDYQYTLDKKVYKNYQLNITDAYNQTSSTNPIIKVTSKNAINSLRDVTSTNFEAEISVVGGTTVESDINKYLTSTEMVSNKIERTKAIKFLVTDVAIGQKDFCIKLTDRYGYVIKFYFSLVAPSNPKYATGSLEFVEGKTFDIGAQYSLVDISEYNIAETIYYPIADTSKYNDYIKEEKLYSISGSDNSVNVVIINEDANDKEKAYYKEGIVKDGDIQPKLYKVSDATKHPSSSFYVKLDSNQAITTTTDVFTALNLPYGKGKDDKGKDDADSIMYINNDNYIKIANGDLKISKDGFSLVTKSPEEVAITDENAGNAENHIDTIELSGIEAFGYENKNENAKDPASSTYFSASMALDNLYVTSIQFKYQKDDGTYTHLKTLDRKDGDGNFERDENKLATTNSLYKYGSETAIGRNVIWDNYTVPTMPGWIYGNKDYAYIYMFINLSASGATYSLPIEIKVTKTTDHFVEDKVSATNVGDNVEFNVASHFAKGDDNIIKADKTFYNDTIVVTLPKAPAKVTAKITATKGSETLTGTTTLSANSTSMDTTHYLSISKVVGKTLDPSWTVNVTFSDYDLSAVTRSGNFGFYATYNYNDDSELKVFGQGPTEQTLTEETVGWEYVYGFGKTKADDINKSKLTLVKSVDGTKFYYVATEKISDIGDGKGEINEKTPMIEAKKVDDAYVMDEKDNYCLPDSGETTYNVSCIKELKTDKLYLTDMGSLTNGYQQITKYYIVKYAAANKNAEYYQYDKIYNIYPTYYNATTESIINRIDTYKTGEDDNYYYFGVSDWGQSLDLQTLKEGGNYNVTEPIKLSNTEIGCFYFELGDENTTAAKISSDGTLAIKKSEYNLNGQEYVSINVYIKASGEMGEYYDDTMSYSGNNLNRPLITIKLYLNGETSFNATVERIKKLEELAGKWIADTAYSTYTARQLAVMYIRTGNYDNDYWNGLAGTIPDGFVTYVNDNYSFTNRYGSTDDVRTLRTLASLTPNGSTEEIDFVHLMAVINMYDKGITPSGIYATLYPSIYDKTDIADLGGWGGDLVDLITDIKGETGTYASILNKAKEKMGSADSRFGSADYYADLDASNIWNTYLKDSNTTLANALINYYNSSYQTRATIFSDNEEMSSITVDQLKSRLLENELINTDNTTLVYAGVSGLMQTRGISTTDHANHIKAACEAFLDYLKKH